MEPNTEKFNTPETTEEEFRAKQAEKVIDFLDRIKAFDYVKGILNNDEEKPNFKQFEDFLVRINGIARDIPIHERTADGNKVYLSGFVDDVTVPRHEDKENLLQGAYEKGLLIDKGDLKYLLPAVINAVHLFSDGNGRTSRLVHLLLKNYQKVEEFDAELKKALSESGRFDSLNIDPGLISAELEQEVLKKHGWVYDEENPLGAPEPIKLGLASVEIQELEKANLSYQLAKKLFNLYSSDASYVLTAIFMELGDSVRDFIVTYPVVSKISPKKMLAVLNPEQWENIINNFYQLKKEQVETLIDVFVKPQEHLVSDDDKETVKDLFIKRIGMHHGL